MAKNTEIRTSNMHIHGIYDKMVSNNSANTMSMDNKIVVRLRRRKF
jgi:DNA polymerase III epsilon subunit-like protein